jgi:HK97 family phage major capsid protein
MSLKRITDVRSDIATKKARRKAIMDKAVQENRSRTSEETTEWTNLGTEVTALETELRDLEAQEAENRASAQPVNAPAVHTDKKDLSNFSIFRGLALMSEGKQLDGVEKEVHEIGAEQLRSSGQSPQGFAVPCFVPKEKRGQTATGTTSATGDQGGDTIPTQLNGLIEALWSKNFLSEVGATRLAGLTGNQEFPVQSTKPAASERTEIQALSDTEILFDKVAMSPARRGVTIPVSKQIMIQSSLDIQALVIDQIRKALNYKLDVDAITAILAAITSGNGNLVELGAAGATASYEDIVNLETIVANNNADKGALKYLTNSKVRGKAKVTQKFASTNGDPLWEKGNEMNGYPSVVANTVPSNLTKGASSGICSAIVFGNFADCYVGMWGGMDFVVDPYTLAKNHQVQITANMFWDVEVARALSFAGIKDALTA